MRIAHLAFNLGARHERGDRIDHQHVNRVGAHQRIDDFQRLFAGVGLRNNQLVNIDAQLGGITGIKRVFGINEGDGAASFLRFGQHVQRQRGFARAFRPVNLDHAAFGQTADAERNIEAQRAGRNQFDIHGFTAAQLHRRAFAKSTINLGKSSVQRLLTVHV